MTTPTWAHAKFFNRLLLAIFVGSMAGAFFSASCMVSLAATCGVVAGATASIIAAVLAEKIARLNNALLDCLRFAKLHNPCDFSANDRTIRVNLELLTDLGFSGTRGIVGEFRRKLMDWETAGKVPQNNVADFFYAALWQNHVLDSLLATFSPEFPHKT